MTDRDDIFATSPNARAQFDRLGGQIPVLLVDNIFADPMRVRQMALNLPYEPAGAHYPGRKARVPQGNDSLTNLLRKLVALVTREYVPMLPPFPDGRRPTVRSPSRPERHYPFSFPTIRLAIARLLSTWLPRCPLCHRWRRRPPSSNAPTLPAPEDPRPCRTNGG